MTESRDEKPSVSEVFERGDLKLILLQSERRGRAALTLQEGIHGLTAEELEALGRFFLNFARRMNR